SVHPEPGSNSSLYIPILQVLPLALVSRKKLTLVFFDICYNISVLACTFSLSIFSTNYPVSNGTAKVGTFFEPPKFFERFLTDFSTWVPSPTGMQK
ncbi:MAG: hypothetical protein IJ578_05345, partial [Bacteroidales bacterium]|nr:hypothetical protein [Bacteroidales bacterium]